MSARWAGVLAVRPMIRIRPCSWNPVVSSPVPLIPLSLEGPGWGSVRRPEGGQPPAPSRLRTGLATSAGVGGAAAVFDGGGKHVECEGEEQRGGDRREQPQQDRGATPSLLPRPPDPLFRNSARRPRSSSTATIAAASAAGSGSTSCPPSPPTSLTISAEAPPSPAPSTRSSAGTSPPSIKDGSRSRPGVLGNCLPRSQSCPFSSAGSGSLSHDEVARTSSGGGAPPIRAWE